MIQRIRPKTTSNDDDGYDYAFYPYSTWDFCKCIFKIIVTIIFTYECYVPDTHKILNVDLILTISWSMCYDYPQFAHKGSEVLEYIWIAQGLPANLAIKKKQKNKQTNKQTKNHVDKLTVFTMSGNSLTVLSLQAVWDILCKNMDITLSHYNQSLSYKTWKN